MGRGGRRGNGGPIGLLVRSVGQGVGMAAEYHEHRKQKKEQLRQAAEQADQAVAGPSTIPNHAEHPDREILDTEASEFPPTYAESTEQDSDQVLARGQRPADEKEKAASLSDISISSDEDLDRDLIDADEADWVLDEAQPPTYEESEQGDRSTEGFVRDVLNINAAAAKSRQALLDRKPLPFPVIIPQRRPGSKARGFVRAYAPDLNDCGIDQDTFLAFLKKFHQSSKASPIFPIIQVSAMIAGFAPSVIAMAVSTAVGAAAAVGAEVQSRQRTNNFLDRMNEELFQPAGLYALIMKYKPETNAAPSIFNMFTAQKADLSTDQMIAKYSRNILEGSKNGRAQKFRLGDGTTRGAIALPESAPLVFPGLDNTLATNDGSKETFKDKTRDAKKFIADYMDRRAQMKYASEDPDSSLVVPVEGRKSKAAWTNPDHAMYRHGIFGLVTGGALSHDSRRERRGHRNDSFAYDRQQQLYERRERNIAKFERRIEQGRELDDRRYARYERLLADREWREQHSNSSMAPYGQDFNRSSYGPSRQQGRQRSGGIKRLMKQDVLYLMIVNLPSEAELEEARRQLQQR